MKRALARDVSTLSIDAEARALVQVAVTEFICFITSDIIEEISKERRVAIKEQDIIESLDKMGYTHYVPILETMMRKLSDTASAHSLQASYNNFLLSQQRLKAKKSPA